MPANLTPEAQAKLAEYSQAKTVEEKIRALEEFLKVAPKHKGAENLLYWAKRRLAELREELEKQKQRKKGGRSPFTIEKEGAAQIALLGIPNSGKSSLLARLTRAKVEISPRPLTTVIPVVGMLPYEDINFQLVELPGIMPNVGWVHRSIGLAKNSDLIAIVVDMSLNPIKQLEYIFKELEDHGLTLRKPQGRVIVERSGLIGIRILNFGHADFSIDELKELLKQYRIHGATVKIFGKVTLEDVEKAILGMNIYKPIVIILNKMDVNGAKEKAQMVEKWLRERGYDMPVLKVSAKTGEGLKDIAPTIFKVLDIIRVYTKKPNAERAERPLVLRRGATVEDVVRSIHSRMLEGFRYAKIWGPSAKYPGERVGLEHILEDGDVVEIHYRG